MITLSLEERDAQLLLNALAARPYMEVAGLIQRIMEQVAPKEEPFAATPPGLDD